MGDKDGVFWNEGKNNTNSTFITNNLFYSSMAKKQVNQMEKIKKIFKHLISLVRPILITSNLLVFTTFIVTGFVMYKLNNRDIGMILFLAAFLYVLFNKIESMDRRIKILEEK